MNVGLKIKTLRDASGFTKGKLATLSDVSATYIGQLEAESKQPTVEILSRICDALGITLSDFFAEEKAVIPLELSCLLAESRNLSLDQVRALTSFIRAMKGD